MKLDYSQITSVEVDGIYPWDSPDFCDAYIEKAYYKGQPMSEAQLDELNCDSSYVYEQVMKRLY